MQYNFNGTWKNHETGEWFKLDEIDSEFFNFTNETTIKNGEEVKAFIFFSMDNQANFILRKKLAKEKLGEKRMYLKMIDKNTFFLDNTIFHRLTTSLD
ncbi:MAG: hypothetical protein PHH30_08185 [Bacteroidales bacterium]|nr:hypothetical protein [Bacteroidales bacterium]